MAGVLGKGMQADKDEDRDSVRRRKQVFKRGYVREGALD
jgi:hypothetical protein